MYQIKLLKQNGDIVDIPMHEVESAEVIKELNCSDMFTMEWTGRDDHLNTLTTCIMVKDNDGEIIFGGRIISYERNIYGNYTIEAEGALSYLNDYIVAPFQINSGDGWSSTKRVKALYNYIADAYNHVASITATTWNYLQMNPSYCTVEDDTGLANVGTEEYITCLDCLKEKLLDKTGLYAEVVYHKYEGYFEPRLYIRDVFTEEINQNIALGSNIIDSKLNVDFSDLFTCIVPLGAKSEDKKYKSTCGRVNIKSVNNNKLHIDNANAINKYGIICKQVNFDNITKESNLLTKGTDYLGKNCKPTYSIELTAFDLHQLDVNIDKLKVGRSVNVVISTMDISTQMIIDKYTYDLCHPENSVISMGDKIKKLSTFSPIQKVARDLAQKMSEQEKAELDQFMINKLQAIDIEVSGDNVTATINGVEVTGELVEPETLMSGDYIIQDENDNVYKVLFDALDDEQETSVKEADSERLVSGKNIIVDNILASKIFAQDITATGTINGATLVGTHAEIDSGRFGNMFIDNGGLSTDDGFVNRPGEFFIRKGGNEVHINDTLPGNPDFETKAKNGYRHETQGSTELVTGSLILNRTPFNELLKVVTKTSAVTSSIASQGTATITAPVNNEDGYTPIAVVGYQLNGSSNQSSLHTYRIHLNGNNAEARVRNMHTSTAVSNAQVMFYVLYMKNIGV